MSGVPGMRVSAAGIEAGMTPETALLLERGKLEQTCPKCGRREAAGPYCSGCFRSTGPDDWQPTARSDAQRTASRDNARMGAGRRSRTGKTASPGTLA